MDICPLAHLDADNRHRLILDCPDCTARTLEFKSLEEVETWWRNGVLSTDARDGYRHNWAISAPRDPSYDAWKVYPASEKARQFANALSRITPSGRAYC